MHKFFKILKFFRIVNESNTLSLTNLILICFSIKLLFFGVLNSADFIPLVLGLLNYMHQRHCVSGSKQTREVMQGEIEKLTQENQTQLGQMSQTITEMQSRVNSLQVQKQLTGKPASVNPLQNINRYPNS